MKKETGDIRVDEVMPVLFEDWFLLPFVECIEEEKVKYVKLSQKETFPDGQFPVVDQGEELVNGYVDDENLLYKGPLPVIIFGDHTRRLKYIDFKFAVGADETKLLSPKKFLDPRFFFYYLQSLNIQSDGYSRHYKYLLAIYVPLPPLAEQARIVTVLDELLGRVRTAQEQLATVPKLLKRFRQGILSAAVLGKLTEDWREEIADDLPLSWRLDALKNIGEISGGLTLNAKRQALPFQVDYLRVANVYANELKLDEIKKVGVTEAEYKKTLLTKGDLLIVEGNGSVEQIGRVALWDGSISPCLHQNHLIRVRIGEDTDTLYVLYYLLSPPGRDAIVSESSSTTGLHTLSISKVGNLEIPLTTPRRATGNSPAGEWLVGLGR